MAAAAQAETLSVTYKDVSQLKPYLQNSRVDSPKQIRLVACSIETFGWTNPILVDDDCNVIAGHARLEAAKALKLSQVPTICLSNMTAAQKRAYVIADNRMNEVAGSWDRKILAMEHQAIQLVDPSFDITMTGFVLEDVEIMIDGLTEAKDGEAIQPDLTRPAISMLGDLWLLGEHKILCADALLPGSFEMLLGKERAQIVITDAPYNVKVNGNVARRGKFSEFVMASGEMSSEGFATFLTTAFRNLVAFSVDGSIHFLFMDWRHMPEMVEATCQYTEMKNLICWNKQSAGMGTFYRSQHELIWVMKAGTDAHINNFGLGEKGRHRTNVWNYPGLAGWSPARARELAMHPTVKPVSMIVEALKDCSKKRGIVLDCFGGSGSTLIAAEQTGRRARLIELDPVYVDVAVRRWQADTGRKAILADDGRSYDEIEQGGR
jgi:DNA modification methylase